MQYNSDIEGMNNFYNECYIVRYALYSKYKLSITVTSYLLRILSSLSGYRLLGSRILIIF